MSEIQERPRIRWGILGAGRISTLFVKDLITSNNDPSMPVQHVIQAIGTSSYVKGEAFVNSTLFGVQCPKLYIDYNDLFADTQVEVVYIGIPHSLHKQACLAAMAAKKHVLCEKPMAINVREVDEMIIAAKQNDVFLMEGVWTRFLPIVQKLQQLIHIEKTIGEISRMYCDFSCDIKMDSLPPTSRMKDIKLGGGSLLDLGIYPLTLSNLILDSGVGDKAMQPKVISSMTVVDGIDHSDVIVVNYTSRKSLGILTASFRSKTADEFCRIEGGIGTITLSGPMAAKPERIKVTHHGGYEEEVYIFEHQGMGLQFEANAVALDILAGERESSIMPLSETRRILKIMDDVRKDNGVVYS
ncbi:hypothetical protein F5884DRAFT_409532 [Xylogone sp. PMI_703]|nr:hypothetical protein F5884DRAFT_409532 [Xylogone sp. PMI_703]